MPQLTTLGFSKLYSKYFKENSHDYSSDLYKASTSQSSRVEIQHLQRLLSPLPKPCLFILRRLAPGPPLLHTLITPFHAASLRWLQKQPEIQNCTINSGGHGGSPPWVAWPWIMALFPSCLCDCCPESHSLKLKGTISLGVPLGVPPPFICLCLHFNAPLSVSRGWKIRFHVHTKVGLKEYQEVSGCVLISCFHSWLSQSSPLKSLFDRWEIPHL